MAVGLWERGLAPEYDVPTVTTPSDATMLKVFRLTAERIGGR